MNSQMEQKIQAMREGGKILAEVRDTLARAVAPGISFEELEALAQKLLDEHGVKPSFTTVEGYHWITCITKNEGCCHGIPKGNVVKDGDIITIDVGLVHKGYHTDTSITVPAGKVSKEVLDFLEVGKQALANAIKKAVAGNTVYDVSKAIQDTIETAGFSPVYQLTGHGISRVLHEEPNIPCVAHKRDKRYVLKVGKTIAIEPMFAMRNATLKVGDDGWTYETEDGSLTGMFEHTVLVQEKVSEILTKGMI